MIARGEPAILVCHWPGMYFNGQETGFKIFQEVVQRLDQAYDHLTWMKLSEISRYWAARELTRIERGAAGSLAFHAPFACPQFTLKLDLNDEIAAGSNRVRQKTGEKQTELASVGSMSALKPGSVFRREHSLVACLDLPKGSSHLEL